MIEQYELQSPDDTDQRIEKLKKSHPLPAFAQWMVCDEQSGFFVMTK